MPEVFVFAFETIDRQRLLQKLDRIEVKGKEYWNMVEELSDESIPENQFNSVSVRREAD